MENQNLKVSKDFIVNSCSISSTTPSNMDQTNTVLTSSSNNEKILKIKLDVDGQWKKNEIEKFFEGYLRYGNDWGKIKEIIATRTRDQIRSHAQKLKAKIKSVLRGQLNEENMKKFFKKYYPDFNLPLLNESHIQNFGSLLNNSIKKIGCKSKDYHKNYPKEIMLKKKIKRNENFNSKDKKVFQINKLLKEKNIENNTKGNEKSDLNFYLKKKNDSKIKKRKKLNNNKNTNNIRVKNKSFFNEISSKKNTKRINRKSSDEELVFVCPGNSHKIIIKNIFIDEENKDKNSELKPINNNDENNYDKNKSINLMTSNNHSGDQLLQLNRTLYNGTISSIPFKNSPSINKGNNNIFNFNIFNPLNEHTSNFSNNRNCENLLYSDIYNNNSSYNNYERANDTVLKDDFNIFLCDALESISPKIF